MHWFLDPITQHYADFEGRATRQQYGMFTLISIIVAFLFGFVLALLSLDYLAWVYHLAIFLPSLAIGVRRIHDLGRSGWWILMMFIPLLNLALFIGLLVRKGDVGSNQYGSSPYAEANTQEQISSAPDTPKEDQTEV